jgi:ATP synthase protein I
LDNKTNSSAPNSPGKKPADYVQGSVLGMELPFTFVGAVALGGFIGYFLDKWLHTGPWLMSVFGCFGFAAGILEIARRMRPKN